MSSQLKNVIVVGASGSVGRPILDALVADGSFNLSVLARPESKSSFPASVQVHRRDYSPESLDVAFKGQDAVVSALGSMQLEQQVPLIEAAARNGVKRFLPSEYGANTADPALLKAIPLMQPKLDMISLLREKEKDGLTWTALITGLFFEWCLNTGLFGFNLQEHTALIIDDGMQQLRSSNFPFIGRAVVAVLKNPDVTANRYTYVASFQLSQQEVLRFLEKTTGKTFKVEHAKSEDKRRVGGEKMAKGDMSGIVELLQGSVVAGIDEKPPLDNKLLGLPEKEDLEEWTAKVVAGQGA